MANLKTPKSPFWDPQTLFAGLPVAVLLSGPSMSRQVADAVRDSGIRTIAVSDQGVETEQHGALAPWADVLYSQDFSWWRRHPRHVEFAGIRCAPQHEYHPLPEDLMSQGVRIIEREMTLTPFIGINPGSSSGYGACCLAWLMGASRVLLFGADMRMDTRAKPHWFGYHPHEPEWYRSPYPRFVDEFRVVAPAYRDLGMQLVNCTPGGALSEVPGIVTEPSEVALAAAQEDSATKSDPILDDF